MIRSFLAFISLFFCSVVLGQVKIDVLHYRFDIKLNDISDSIDAIANIRFVITEKKPASTANEIKLDLKSRETKGKGMSVMIVQLLPTEERLKFRQEKENLFIRCPESVKINDTISLSVHYKGIPADGLIISKNKFGKRTFFADNWPNRAHNWLCCVDDPADKAPVEFYVTAPTHYQVISNGIQTEETNLPGEMKLTAYKEDLPLSTKIMVIGVAEFAVAYNGMVNDCIPVTTWVFPENKGMGFSDYQPAHDVLAFLSNYIGPYPFKKLANVQSKTIFGGMENASAIFYFENSVDGLRDQETLFAHEITHQWFGDMATEKSFAHLWLSEGFATYLTHLYVESKYGADSLMKRMRKERQEVLAFGKSDPRPVVDPTPNYMSLLNDNSYQKGGWVLHMLRMQLGDSIFQQSIRQYYQMYAGKNADTKDLQHIFESVSGKNLETFFNQWLYTPENPFLNVTWKFDKAKNEATVNIKQTTKTVFEFPLRIAIISDTGAGAMYNKKIDQREQQFILSFPGNPANIALDPFVSLLFNASVKQID